MVPKRVERALRRGGVRGGMVMRLFCFVFSLYVGFRALDNW